MIGKIRQKLIALDQPLSQQALMNICSICERPIPDSQKDAHHLIPKSKGGKETTFLHRICHKHIHALFTEVELANRYHQIQILKEHPEMKKFIHWVSSKPPAFYEKTHKSARLKPGK